MEGTAREQSLIGTTIGNYRVSSKLGEGGMGAVYLAEHPLIGKKVALKVLHEEYSANQEVVTRFFTEAKAVNDIGHPNIVDIIDYGRAQIGGGPAFVYFFMEFLAGKSLSEAIAAGAMPVDRALKIAIQVADALSASHKKGIIHRDLKPDNVVLVERGQEKDFVKVLDFGIAKLTGGSTGSTRTRTGMVMGTPAYMSPEQCEGKGNMDHRTDVYALGVVLFEMITGRVPFTGQGYGEVLVQHLTVVPPRPTTIRAEIPPHIENVILKALEKKRENRYESMDDFITAMKDPSSVPSYPSAISDEDDENEGPKSKGPVIAAVVVAALVISGAGYFLFGPGGDAALETAVTQATATPQSATPAPGASTAASTAAITEKVKISVASTPAGAQVFLGDVAKGKTPVEIAMEKSDKEVELTVKLDGYKDHKAAMKPDQNSNVTVSLQKLVEKSTEKPHRKPSSEGSGSKKPAGGGFEIID